MRRLAALAAAAALALAGCGGDDAESPLDEALGYLSADAPFVAVASTDLDGSQYRALGELTGKVPFGDQLTDTLKQELEGEGVDFEQDIEPLLGNPVVIGALDPRSFLEEDDPPFVMAVKAKDGGKLEELASKSGEEIGDVQGATVYRADDTIVAVDDDVLLLASSEEAVRAALERRGQDDRLREADVQRALEGLPKDAIARVYANVGALLEASPETADARKIPWVGALETFGAVATVQDDRVGIDFRLRTEEGELSAEELPLAPGAEAPPVLQREGEVGLGVRDLAHIVEFAERAGQAVDPAGFGQYEQAKRQLAEGLDVDIDRDIIQQLSGNVAVSAGVDGGFAVRAEVRDPRALEETLRELVDVIPGFAEGAGFGEVGVAEPGEGEDFYAVAQAGGGSIVYGVVDDVFVLATDAERAAELAEEEPRQVPGAQGAVVLSANAEQVANEILAQMGGSAALGGALFTGPLGDLAGSLSSDQSGLRGSFTLGIE